MKSPHTEYHMYDAWVEKNFNIDAAGSTSANLPTLGHRICGRPIFPLDWGTEFTANITMWRAAMRAQLDARDAAARS